MAYEQAGEPAKARPCWRKYLEIEPTGTWAEIARKHPQAQNVPAAARPAPFGAA